MQYPKTVDPKLQDEITDYFYQAKPHQQLQTYVL